MKRIIVAAGMVVLSAVALGAEWRNLTEDNYYSGPKITADDLVGKVVLVDEWGINCPPCRALLPFRRSRLHHRTMPWCGRRICGVIFTYFPKKEA